MEIIELEIVPSVPYQKMYTTLFSAITTALDLMEHKEIMKARALLMQAQQETEELYISANE